MTSLLALALQDRFVHEPTHSYAIQRVRGWTVMVSRRAKDEPKTKLALETLDDQLRLVESAVPGGPLAALKKVRIWIEWNNPKFPCACYHPSADWLSQNGFNVDKTGGVEIANPQNFVDWIALNQPYMVLHELAHAYHDQVYGFDDAYVMACYKLVQARGIFESVDHNRGGKRWHYALNDPMEYFAESTEAYFGQNDFAPFDRGALRSTDPQGYDMIERKWRVKENR